MSFKNNKFKKRSKSFDFINYQNSDSNKLKKSYSLNYIESIKIYKNNFINDKKVPTYKSRIRDQETFPISRSPQIHDIIKMLDIEFTPPNPQV